MSWEDKRWLNEAEHLRDKGRTWGPGVDDVEELTEEEIARQDALMEAYRQKLKEYSVEPRKVFVEAGEALRAIIPSAADETAGRAPLDWREKVSDTKLELCKKACETLGYSLEYGWTRNHLDKNQETATFSVSLEHYGWLPDKGGNLHKFFVCGIKNVEDCLQLVADFSAIGKAPTTWYGENFHYTCSNSGELRYELIKRYGVGIPENNLSVPSKENETLDAVIRSAVARSDNGAVSDKDREFEKD